jgi:hypothetical protein
VRKRLFGTRRRIAVIVLAGAALVTAVAAYAYFTASGTGTGSAQTATTAALTVTQVGAGYDSLIPSGSYHQDQCFACAQISKFGNDITLANPGAQRLTSVVVAFRNWGGAITGLPVTLTINNTTNGPVTFTQSFDFPAAQLNGRPTVSNITFDLVSASVFVQQEFVYGLSFNPSGQASGLNVALSSSALNLVLGTDTHPGTVWVDTTAGAGIAGDFPTCTIPGVGFAQVTTDCGPYAAGNPGAYGTPAQVAAGSADIPAVEFNVVGGIAPGLTPGGPAQPIDFAITNPGSSSVHVDQVVTSVSSLSGTGSDGSIEACDSGMYPVAGSTAVINATVPPGTTVFANSGTSISMTDDGNNQDNCKGATVNLAFAAS